VYKCISICVFATVVFFGFLMCRYILCIFCIFLYLYVLLQIGIIITIINNIIDVV